MHCVGWSTWEGGWSTWERGVGVLVDKLTDASDDLRSGATQKVVADVEDGLLCGDSLKVVVDVKDGVRATRNGDVKVVLGGAVRNGDDKGDRKLGDLRGDVKGGDVSGDDIKGDTICEVA